MVHMRLSGLSMPAPTTPARRSFREQPAALAVGALMTDAFRQLREARQYLEDVRRGVAKIGRELDLALWSRDPSATAGHTVLDLGRILDHVSLAPPTRKASAHPLALRVEAALARLSIPAKHAIEWRDACARWGPESASATGALAELVRLAWPDHGIAIYADGSVRAQLPGDMTGEHSCGFVDLAEALECTPAPEVSP